MAFMLILLAFKHFKQPKTVFGETPVLKKQPANSMASEYTVRKASTAFMASAFCTSIYYRERSILWPTRWPKKKRNQRPVEPDSGTCTYLRLWSCSAPQMRCLRKEASGSVPPRGQTQISGLCRVRNSEGSCVDPTAGAVQRGAKKGCCGKGKIAASGHGKRITSHQSKGHRSLMIGAFSFAGRQK